MKGDMDSVNDDTSPAGTGDVRQAILPVPLPETVIRERPGLERALRRLPLGDAPPAPEEGPLVGLGTVIVIPCYNEATRLPRETVRAFAAEHPGTGLLFVDDGSRDATAAVLRELCAELGPQATMLQLPENRGKAEAVRTGMRRAFETGARYVAYWDADLATPLELVPAFEAVLEKDPGLLLVLGARVQLLGRQIERRLTRHYAGRLFATAASFTLRLRVYDTQCGAKMFRVTDEVRGVFADPFRSRWIFDVEILARLLERCRGAGESRPERRMYEYPLPRWTDVQGSKLSLRHYVNAALDLAGIWRRHRPS